MVRSLERGLPEHDGTEPPRSKPRFPPTAPVRLFAPCQEHVDLSGRPPASQSGGGAGRVARRVQVQARHFIIVLLEAGGVAEVGTHDELVCRGGAYARLLGAHEPTAA